MSSSTPFFEGQASWGDVMLSSTGVTTKRNDLGKPTFLGHKPQPSACLTQTLPTRTLLLQAHQANFAQLFLLPSEKGLSAQISSSCKPALIPGGEDCFLLNCSCAVNPLATHTDLTVLGLHPSQVLSQTFLLHPQLHPAKTAVYSPIHCTSLP